MKSACFTGHRKISHNIEELSTKLYCVVEKMIKKDGITDFFNGGAIGWDILTAKVVLKLKETYPQVQLHMILPCTPEEQSENWTEEQKKEYFYVLESADTVRKVSEYYFDGCMKVRNAELVRLAGCCFCYWNGNYRTGTGQTVKMAYRKNIMTVNFFAY